MDGRPSNPQLEHLRRIRPQLDSHQTGCLEVLEKLQPRLQTDLSNGELLELDPAIPQLRGARAALERQASFLLASPIVGHIFQSIDNLVLSTTLPLAEPARHVLTAQIAGVRQVIARNNARAIHAARSGKRFCPLSLRTEAFAAFLAQQEPALRELIDACRQDGPARPAALTAPLLALARAYLQQARLVPKGLPLGQGFVFDGHEFGNAPVSLTLPAQPQSSSTLNDALDGEAVAILIGLDDLEHAQVDPAHGSMTSQMHALGFEQCDPLLRQAAVFLQKLFLELAHVEEKIYLGRRVSKDGSGLTECARTTRRELDYQGSVLLCDSMVAMSERGLQVDDGGQRKYATETIGAVATIAKAYRKNHGEPIVADAALAAWLDGPAAHRDLAALEHPASRLQLAAMPEIAGLLLQTGVFTGKSQVPGAPTTGLRVESTAAVTVNPAGSRQPDFPALPA